jgi:hypothetical protein
VVLGRGAPVCAPASSRTDLRTTLADLDSFENRAELDRVIRAVCLDLDCDYLDGLRSLEGWAAAAAS